MTLYCTVSVILKAMYSPLCELLYFQCPVFYMLTSTTWRTFSLSYLPMCLIVSSFHCGRFMWLYLYMRALSFAPFTLLYGHSFLIQLNSMQWQNHLGLLYHKVGLFIEGGAWIKIALLNYAQHFWPGDCFLVILIKFFWMQATFLCLVV